MPIDVTKYINRTPNRSLEDEHEDPKNPEGDTGDDEDPVDREDAVEDEEGLADSSPNFSESDVEDSRDPGTSSPEQGAGRESSVPDDPKMNEAETDSDLEQLLIDTGPQRLEDLTTATESVRTTFRLGTEAQALFDRLAGRTGKSKKELIGIALRLSQEGWVNKRDAFQKTAESLEIEGATRIPMAIAPRTREGLNDLRDETGIKRNRLVELGIRLAEAALKRQVRRRIIPHRDVQSDLMALRKDTDEIRRKLSGHQLRSSGRTARHEHRDPVERGLFEILHMLTEMRDAIENEVESGEPMGHREFP